MTIHTDRPGPGEARENCAGCGDEGALVLCAVADGKRRARAGRASVHGMAVELRICEGCLLEIAALIHAPKAGRLREELAKFVHHMLQSWLAHTLKTLLDALEQHEGKLTTAQLLVECEEVARWQRVIGTELDELPDDDEKAAYAWADRLLGFMASHQMGEIEQALRDWPGYQRSKRKIDELRQREQGKPTGIDDPRIKNRSGKIVVDRVTKAGHTRRQVLHPSDKVKPGDVFVCARPHDDGRFDYLCGSKWCRCTS